MLVLQIAKKNISHYHHGWWAPFQNELVLVVNNYNQREHGLGKNTLVGSKMCDGPT